MTLFWISAAVLTVLALLFLVLPMLGTRAPAGNPGAGERVGAGVSVYKAQLADLEADRESGVISEEQFQTARLDLQRGLLEMSDTATASPHTPKHSWRLVTGLTSLVAVPILAVVIYHYHGTGADGLDPQPIASEQSPQMMTADGIQAAIGALSDRLEANPEDPDGWALLGRSLRFLDQPRAAAAAYAQAIRYGGGDDADTLLSYADLLGSLDSGDLSTRALPFIERALSLEPDHASGLWLAGLAAYRGSDYKTAQEYWARLESRLQPNSEESLMIRRNLDEIEARLAQGAQERNGANSGTP